MLSEVALKPLKVEPESFDFRIESLNRLDMSPATPMHTPSVSFVVPCYNLAHLLPECVNSLLAQTYRDFEVLIMDDRSPDATSEVARSFTDSRVRYIRNPRNLGHLRNYNRGIELSRGRYVWLISADDYLGKPYVLERYVALMDANPQVGYVFCPGVAVGERSAAGISEWVARGRRIHGEEDRILKGHTLLKRLLVGNTIVAASGLVRRECYDRHGVFPLNMPWAGDWYVWCLFALYHDVAYFADPMVCYREHNLSMTSRVCTEDPAARREEQIAILIAIKEKADEAGFPEISRWCLSAIAAMCATGVATRRSPSSPAYAGLTEWEEALANLNLDKWEQQWVRARLHANIGDIHYRAGRKRLAWESYRHALKADWRLPKVVLKSLLLSLGPSGDRLRRCVAKAPPTRTVC